MRSEILRSGGIGFRLAFVTGFGMLFLYRSGGSYVVLIFDMVAFTRVHFFVRSVMLFGVMRFVLMEFFVMCFFVVLAGARQRFTWKQFDGSNIRGRLRWRRRVRVLVWLAVIVVLEVFENVADVEECVAVEADVHESGLHAR